MNTSGVFEIDSDILVRLDSGLLDDFSPFFGFVSNELCGLLRA
jgi:hypothetical protein